MFAPSEVRRTIKRAEIWALFLPLANLVGPAGIYSVKRGAVQALKKDGMNCTVVNHKDADLCIQV